MRRGLRAHVPAHNSWQPRLMILVAAALEYGGGWARGGHFLGMTKAGRVATATTDRELRAALALLAPVQRVLAVVSRAALLPDGRSVRPRWSW
jgi:hypothetical protein